MAGASLGAVARSVSRVYAITSSHSLRVWQNAIARRPCCTHSASSRLISTMGLLRRSPAGTPAAP